MFALARASEQFFLPDFRAAARFATPLSNNRPRTCFLGSRSSLRANSDGVHDAASSQRGAGTERRQGTSAIVPPGQSRIRRWNSDGELTRPTSVMPTIKRVLRATAILSTGGQGISGEKRAINRPYSWRGKR